MAAEEVGRVFALHGLGVVGARAGARLAAVFLEEVARVLLRLLRGLGVVQVGLVAADDLGFSRHFDDVFRKKREMI